MDTPADKAPMTVKGMPVRARQRALKAAAKQDQSMAEWLTRAIDQLADREEGVRETFPDEAGKPGKPLALPSPTVIPEGFLTDLADTMRAAHAVSEASGIPIPKATVHHAYAVLANHLRFVRGLPPVKPRQTQPRIGQTSNHK